MQALKAAEQTAEIQARQTAQDHTAACMQLTDRINHLQKHAADSLMDVTAKHMMAVQELNATINGLQQVRCNTAEAHGLAYMLLPCRGRMFCTSYQMPAVLQHPGLAKPKA